MAVKVGQKFDNFTVVAVKKARWERYEAALYTWAEMGLGWTAQKQAVWTKYACGHLKVLEMQYKDERDGIV